MEMQTKQEFEFWIFICNISEKFIVIYNVHFKGTLFSTNNSTFQLFKSSFSSSPQPGKNIRVLVLGLSIGSLV